MSFCVNMVVLYELYKQGCFLGVFWWKRCKIVVVEAGEIGDRVGFLGKFCKCAMNLGYM